MKITKVNIQNYKCFEEKFSIDFNEGINVLVGDNEAGKSTIIEAINLALSGILNGKYLRNELSQYLFNHKTISKFLNAVRAGENPSLPYILIEVFFGDKNHPLFEGNGNSERAKGCGVTLRIEFDANYNPEYQELVSVPDGLTTIPIEYYKISWKSFARDSVTARSIPLKSVLIDSTSNRYLNGSDVYISRIIRYDLEDNEKVKLSQAYRTMKDSFITDEAVKGINEKINSQAKITNKKLHISVDLSTQNSWETTLMTYVDDIPFHQIGKGEQCMIKTNLALAHEKSHLASLILLEEPENHLSHTKLNELIKAVTDHCENKQSIISTHSSFVANKLGLENLILLNDCKTVRLSNLSKDTFDFFKKMAGYNTLRLLLCRKAVLVEGDSDELIFQKAYMEENSGRLPIEDGIDVISVKLTFLRFLEIANKIGQPVAVITDNDKDYQNKIVKKYEVYSDSDFIKIFADERESFPTLEPQFADANSQDIGSLCEAIGIDGTKYTDEKMITNYMLSNKTTWAYKVFQSDIKVNYPKYITEAVTWCNE
jgi:putative ATP-dependent endonuclease of OLD family